MAARIAAFLLFVFAVIPMARAQTTQGLIAGRVLDSTSGRPIPGARISATSLGTNATATARAGPSGYYGLALLPPGIYQMRIAANGYQPQEITNWNWRYPRGSISTSPCGL